MPNWSTRSRTKSAAKIFGVGGQNPIDFYAQLSRPRPCLPGPDDENVSDATASVSQQRANARPSRIVFPAASTVRSNCRPHAEQVNVCRSYSRAFSAAGDRRVRNVRLPQFAHGGLSCAPKPRAIRTSPIMTGPPTQFRIASGHANVSTEGLRLVDVRRYESKGSLGCSGRGSWQATTRPPLSRRIMSRSESWAIIAWYSRRAISSRSIRFCSATELGV